MEETTFRGKFWKETLVKNDNEFQDYCHWKICRTKLRRPAGLSLGVVKFSGNVKFKFRIFLNSDGKSVRLIAFCLTPKLLENVVIDNVDSDSHFPHYDYDDLLKITPRNVKITTKWWDYYEDSRTSIFLHVRCLISGAFKKPSMKLISKVSLNKDLAALKEYFDFKICCQDQTFLTHKAILAARSPVFNRMIQTNQMRESENGVLEIKDSSPATVKAMVNFLYLDRLEKNIKEAELEDLLEIGDKYDIKSLRVACQLKLIEMFGEEAVLDKFVKNKIRGCDELIEMAVNIAKSSLK